jgi:hypothetical protein
MDFTLQAHRELPEKPKAGRPLVGPHLGVSVVETFPD